MLEKKLTKYRKHYNCYEQGTHQEVKNYHRQIRNLRPLLEATNITDIINGNSD